MRLDGIRESLPLRVTDSQPLPEVTRPPRAVGGKTNVGREILSWFSSGPRTSLLTSEGDLPITNGSLKKTSQEFRAIL